MEEEIEYTTPNFHRGSIFTPELGEIIESGFDLGMKKYPIFKEEYREELNRKIFDHFWFREIGLETPALFRRFLNRKMNEIMPFYNQLYNSTLYEFNVFVNYDLSTTSETNANHDETRDINRTDETTSNTENDTTANAKGTSRTLVSTTPQMQLSGREDYASNITDTASDSTTTTKAGQEATSNSKSNDNAVMQSKDNQDFLSHVAGISGITNSQALMQFRETFLNIDMLVIAELEELFMGIYTDYMNIL